MKKYFYTILAAVAIVASCAKETFTESARPAGDGNAVFSGTILQPNGLTKVSVVDQDVDKDKVYITWNAGDQIWIKNNLQVTDWPTKKIDFVEPFYAVDNAATTQFSGDVQNLIAEGAAYSARYYGKNDVWKDYVLGVSNDVTCTIDVNPASIENMPLSGEESAPYSGDHYFTFTCQYAILQVNVPSKLEFDDLYVCTTIGNTTQNVTFENGSLKGGSSYTICLKDAGLVKSSEKFQGKDKVTYFIPVPAEMYEYKQITLVAANEGAEVARMATYEYAGNKTTDPASIVLSANYIYFFDFCNTLTIEGDATTYALESKNNIDYKVNIAKEFGTGSSLTINATDQTTAPANIFINSREYKVEDLTINAPYSHVEIDYGQSDNVVSKTSLNSFVVKEHYTISEVKVTKGSVVVEGKDNGEANVKKVTIPADVTEPVKIDVTGVSAEGENRVLIVNKSSKENVVVVIDEDDKDDQEESKEYYVDQQGQEVTPVTDKVVAMIGETKYTTLADAINAATAGQTIKLVSNIALDGPITISKDVTIDGSNFTIAVSDAEYWNQYKVGGANQGLGKVNMITVKASDFTLKNVTLDGKDCRGVSLCTTSGGKNVLYQNITYKGRGCGHYYGEATGLVTFDGCKFDIHGYAVHFGGESSVDDDVVIKNCELNGWSSFGACKSLTITDSHLGGANDEGKNGWLAVLRPYCPTTITNCTFSDMYLAQLPQEGYFLVGLGTGAATTVILDGCKIVNNAKQEIVGSEIYSIVRKDAFEDGAYEGSVFAFDATGNTTDGFTAGTFYAKDPTKIKVQAGYEAYAIEGKTDIYGIRKAQSEAAIKTQAEFETACAAAKSGDKLVLGNGNFAIGPVDIDGKTLTFKGQGAANTTIYIGNGGYDGNGGHGSNKTANMTFEDVTLGDLASDSGYLTGFTQASGLTFRNVTFNVGFSNWGNKGGDVSFFNCTFNQNTAEKYNVQELRSANGTHYLFDGCTFNSTPGRFINAYKQGGSTAFIEIIVKNCSFIGTTQSKAALNLKSNLSDGCVITLYLLGNNTTTNVANGSKTGNSLFDDNGTNATVYQGADKNSASMIWANGTKVE